MESSKVLRVLRVDADMLLNEFDFVQMELFESIAGDVECVEVRLGEPGYTVYLDDGYTAIDKQGICDVITRHEIASKLRAERKRGGLELVEE